MTEDTPMLGCDPRYFVALAGLIGVLVLIGALVPMLGYEPSHFAALAILLGVLAGLAWVVRERLKAAAGDEFDDHN